MRSKLLRRRSSNLRLRRFIQSTMPAARIISSRTQRKLRQWGDMTRLLHIRQDLHQRSQAQPPRRTPNKLLPHRMRSMRPRRRSINRQKRRPPRRAMPAARFIHNHTQRNLG
jgi:hypothetical protein